MDQLKLILMLIYAVKTHNRKLFHYCNGEMAVFFFAYDRHNYSRYLTWFEAFITNLELTHSGVWNSLIMVFQNVHAHSFQIHYVQLIKRWRKPL